MVNNSTDYSLHLRIKTVQAGMEKENRIQSSCKPREKMDSTGLVLLKICYLKIALIIKPDYGIKEKKIFYCFWREHVISRLFRTKEIK